MKLLVPFFLAFLFILPPRLYLVQEYTTFARLDEDSEYIEDNYFKFFFKVLPHLWKKISWLWFLPSLFVDILINYPLLVWA